MTFEQFKTSDRIAEGYVSDVGGVADNVGDVKEINQQYSELSAPIDIKFTIKKSLEDRIAGGRRVSVSGNVDVWKRMPDTVPTVPKLAAVPIVPLVSTQQEMLWNSPTSPLWSQANSTSDPYKVTTNERVEYAGDKINYHNHLLVNEIAEFHTCEFTEEKDEIEKNGIEEVLSPEYTKQFFSHQKNTGNVLPLAEKTLVPANVVPRNNNGELHKSSQRNHNEDIIVEKGGGEVSSLVRDHSSSVAAILADIKNNEELEDEIFSSGTQHLKESKEWLDLELLDIWDEPEKAQQEPLEAMDYLPFEKLELLNIWNETEDPKETANEPPKERESKIPTQNKGAGENSDLELLDIWDDSTNQQTQKIDLWFFEVKQKNGCKNATNLFHPMQQVDLQGNSPDATLIPTPSLSRLCHKKENFTPFEITSSAIDEDNGFDGNDSDVSESSIENNTYASSNNSTSYAPIVGQKDYQHIINEQKKDEQLFESLLSQKEELKNKKIQMINMYNTTGTPIDESFIRSYYKNKRSLKRKIDLVFTRQTHRWCLL